METNLERWNLWQCGVVRAIRDQFEELFGDVSLDDIDWDAWRTLFEEGRSPEAAVERAFCQGLQ